MGAKAGLNASSNLEPKKNGFATNPNRDWTELLRYLFSRFALVNPDFAIGSSAIRLQFELVVIFVRAVW